MHGDTCSPSGEDRAPRGVQPPPLWQQQALQSCSRTPRCHPVVFADFSFHANVCSSKPGFSRCPLIWPFARHAASLDMYHIGSTGKRKLRFIFCVLISSLNCASKPRRFIYPPPPNLELTLPFAGCICIHKFFP